MKKKKIYLQSIVVAICCSLFAITSCEDMLTVDSGRYVTVGKNGLASANDSVTSILGLLHGMQKVGEKYILLGEMRADLMDVTNFTPTYIRQLSDFNVDSTNTYANPRDYYAIINNCNYFISRTAASGSPLKNENAVVHAIRTWTYMQIATNWGKAYYFSKPLLTVNDTKENYPVLDINQLTDSLIADLEPFADAIYPNYGVINQFNSSDLFLPIKVLLGDLYLWRGGSTADYETAATYYSQFIDKKMLLTSASSPSIEWTYSNYNLTTHAFDKGSPSDNWFSSTVASPSSEMVSAIQMATTFSDGIICQIPNNIDYFAASSGVKDLWSKQTYTLRYRANPVSKYVNYSAPGDLRESANLFPYSIKTSTASTNTSVVTKYMGLYKMYNASHILLYRMGLIYLRYAEAVNRAGHPQTAFAVLKYGLNPLTFKKNPQTKDDSIRILPVADQSLPYVNVFNNARYANIIGIHARGCGDADYDATYNIPVTTTDSISWVEDAICNELALETSFEGNRFGDLVRIASRRNDPDFLAKRIASKHEGSEYGRIYGILSDKKNWFLPEPK